MKTYDKYQVVLEDEPKNLSIQNLSTFRIKSEYARASILGYMQVLENDGEGLIEPGEEKLDLGIEGAIQDEAGNENDPSITSNMEMINALANTTLQFDSQHHCLEQMFSGSPLRLVL